MSGKVGREARVFELHANLGSLGMVAHKSSGILVRPEGEGRGAPQTPGKGWDESCKSSGILIGYPGEGWADRVIR